MSEEIKREGGGGHAFLRSLFFVLCILGVYIYVAEVITDISGQGHRGAVSTAVGPEMGKEIFFGKGKCSTCHSLGNEGSAIRCPNLGIVEGADAPFDRPIIQRAALRAEEIKAKTGKSYTPTDYIIESHFNPSAYVVEGFKNEMPVIWKPPIGLNLDEEMAVDAFLQSYGGEVDLAAIANSPIFAELKKNVKALQAESGDSGGAAKPLLVGDPAQGEAFFFDPSSPVPCGKCHTVKGNGGKVGPELTNVGGTRSAEYIMESILEPSKVIASGFEPYLVITKDNEFVTGVKRAEDSTGIELMDDEGEIRKIEKENIEKVVPQKLSIMPGNFKEILTMQQFHDLVAFLVSLT